MTKNHGRLGFLIVTEENWKKRDSNNLQEGLVSSDHEFCTSENLHEQLGQLVKVTPAPRQYCLLQKITKLVFCIGI